LAHSLPKEGIKQNMNMKKLLILAVATVIGSAAFAQSRSTMTYGLKVGLNLPKYSFGQNGDNGQTKTTTNFHVTGYMDAPLGSNFSLQPGISLQGKGGKYFDSGSTQVEQNTMWVEVPVNLVAKFPIATSTKFFLGAGPYGAFGISGKNKFTSGGTTTESDLQFGDKSGDDLQSTDFGVNFITGFQMNSGFNIIVGYGIGLTDLRPSGSGGNGQINNRVWSFSLGMVF
jgi:Outer membrane protein beta-barrel domain